MYHYSIRIPSKIPVWKAAGFTYKSLASCCEQNEAITIVHILIFQASDVHKVHQHFFRYFWHLPAPCQHCTVLNLSVIFFSLIDVLYGWPLLHYYSTYSYLIRHQTFRMNSMTTMTTNNSVSRKVSNKTVTSLASSFNGNHVNSSRAKNCSTHLETPLLSSGEPTPSRNFVWDQF